MTAHITIRKHGKPARVYQVVNRTIDERAGLVILEVEPSDYQRLLDRVAARDARRAERIAANE